MIIQRKNIEGKIQTITINYLCLNNEKIVENDFYVKYTKRKILSY